MKRLQVTYADGRTVAVSPTPGDIVRFERHFDVAVSDIKAPRLEHMVFMAWTGLRRAGDETCEFEQFLDVVTDISEEAPKDAAADGVAAPDSPA